ncbi:MAG TPA: hypothetical protein VER96_31120 [Polyangiaceae bacterium]|nr:hypothetical protein [Polyangiaceae bacterium]
MRQAHSPSSVRACAASSSVYFALLLCSACSVDDRTLLSSEGIGGTRSTPAAGGSPSIPIHSDAGAVELPRCQYLETNVEEGCATLVKNAGFSTNAADWSAEPLGMSEGWVNSDAADSPHSGSLVVTNLNFKSDETAKGGISGGAARQCVPVTSGRIYDLAADLFVPDGQGAGFEGLTYTSTAALSVFFYEEADCAGRTASNFTSDSVSQTDEWVHVEGTTIAPKEALSMAVRLATFKPFRQNVFEAHFDNVFVRERPPE